MSLYYILDKDHNPIPVKDVIEWAKWMETADRKVAQTDVGPLFVSTVFLGLDHRFMGKGPPIVFETMIFGEDQEHEMRDSYCERYETWQQAVEGHEAAVTEAKLRLEQANQMLKENSTDGKCSRDG